MPHEVDSREVLETLVKRAVGAMDWAANDPHLSPAIRMELAQIRDDLRARFFSKDAIENQFHHVEFGTRELVSLEEVAHASKLWPQALARAIRDFNAAEENEDAPVFPLHSERQTRFYDPARIAAVVAFMKARKRG